MHEVYLSLGSNIGDSCTMVAKAFEEISSMDCVHDFKQSRMYLATPVSNEPQRDYVNAACKFNTELSAQEIFARLEEIEKKLGKVPKAKDTPRKIDIDLIFFGQEFIDTPMLKVPHPLWKERLFVLIPLRDLTEIVNVPQPDQEVQTILLREYLQSYRNYHQERVFPL